MWDSYPLNPYEINIYMITSNKKFNVFTIGFPYPVTVHLKFILDDI